MAVSGIVGYDDDDGDDGGSGVGDNDDYAVEVTAGNVHSRGHWAWILNWNYKRIGPRMKDSDF